MRGSRDICFGYCTRFSHRARDDVWPGAVDSTQAATSLPDSRVGRRMAAPNRAAAEALAVSALSHASEFLALDLIGRLLP